MKKLGNKRVLKEFPLDVEFLNEDGDKEVLELTCKVKNPKQFDSYTKKIREAGDDYELAARAVCQLVTGWKNVLDENDKEIEYCEEELVDLQMEHWGLIEAIYSAMTLRAVEIRKKRLMS